MNKEESCPKWLEDLMSMEHPKYINKGAAVKEDSGETLSASARRSRKQTFLKNCQYKGTPEWYLTNAVFTNNLTPQNLPLLTKKHRDSDSTADWRLSVGDQVFKMVPVEEPVPKVQVTIGEVWRRSFEKLPPPSMEPRTNFRPEEKAAFNNEVRVSFLNVFFNELKQDDCDPDMYDRTETEWRDLICEVLYSMPENRLLLPSITSATWGVFVDDKAPEFVIEWSYPDNKPIVIAVMENRDPIAPAPVKTQSAPEDTGAGVAPPVKKKSTSPSVTSLTPTGAKKKVRVLTRAQKDAKNARRKKNRMEAKV